MEAAKKTENHPKIEIGCRIGMLTVTAPTDQRKGRYMVWECRCDCGGRFCWTRAACSGRQ